MTGDKNIEGGIKGDPLKEFFSTEVVLLVLSWNLTFPWAWGTKKFHLGSASPRKAPLPPLLTGTLQNRRLDLHCLEGKPSLTELDWPATIQLEIKSGFKSTDCLIDIYTPLYCSFIWWQLSIGVARGPAPRSGLVKRIIQNKMCTSRIFWTVKDRAYRINIGKPDVVRSER